MTVREKAELIIRDIKSEEGVNFKYEHMKCEFSGLNEQCIIERCPYYG